ncbi:multiple epidermal growth factor-like domains protein 6 [Branchiostoma floridae x Branchiostoma belcheri]
MKWAGVQDLLCYFGLLLVSACLKGSLANNYQYQLYADQPNVCPYQEVAMVGHREPCVRAFTRTVKVWKPNCGSYQDWCVGYERRTAYYTAYRQVYRSTYQTNYRCCQGYQQLNREPGCMYPTCSSGVCFNGGRCNGNYRSQQTCTCPSGFKGPRCQYAVEVGHCSLFQYIDLRSVGSRKGKKMSG